MTSRHRALIRAGLCFALTAFVAAAASAQQPVAKAQAPELVTSSNQSPGPLKITVFLKRG